MKSSFLISVVIPFLNEEDNIGSLANELVFFEATHSHLHLEFILVNDGSTDTSIDRIKNTAFPPNTRLINLSQNFGPHAALRAGILNARGKYITFLYADLQDPIGNIVLMYEKIHCSHKNIIWAFRRNTTTSGLERFFSRMYSRLMQLYVNPKYPEQGFDIVMFDRKVAAQLNRNIEANSSIFLQILNLGFSSDCFYYQKAARRGGKTKWTYAKKIKLLIDSFVAFSFAPIRLVSVIGVVFFTLGTLWTCYIIIRKLIFNDLFSGWPALVSILMLGFGITNICLGIIAEYLWRTLDASRKRPVYVIDNIVEVEVKPQREEALYYRV